MKPEMPETVAMIEQSPGEVIRRFRLKKTNYTLKDFAKRFGIGVLAIFFLWPEIALPLSTPEDKRPLPAISMKAIFGGEHALKEVKNLGFDTIITVGRFIYDFDDTQREAWLKKCRENGLAVIITLKDFFPDNQRGAVNLVNRWKTNSAIFAWLLLDEPNLASRMKDPNYSTQSQKAFYRRIKKADPNRPIITIFIARNPGRTYTTEAFDICSLDRYPVIKGISDWQDFLRDNIKAWISATGNTDIIPIIQAHYGGYSRLDNPVGTIQEQLNIWAEHKMTERGFMIYAWWGGAGAGSIGLAANSELKEEVKNLNLSSLVSLVTPSRAEMRLSPFSLKNFLNNVTLPMPTHSSGYHLS